MKVGYLIDKDYLNSHSLLEYFRVKIDSITTTSAKSYRKAFESLHSFELAHDNCDWNDDVCIADWFVDMFMKGIGFKTSCHFLDLASGLYKQVLNDGVVISENPFARFRHKIKPLDDSIWRKVITEADFSKMIAVTKSADRQTGEIALATDILLLSLLNACMPLATIVRLTKCPSEQFDNESIAIINRHISTKRKYIFDLKQSERTPNQLSRHVNELMIKLFHLWGLPIFGSIEETIAAYWAYAALKCGVSGSEVVRTLGKSPKGMPVLSLYDGISSEKQYSQVSKDVGMVFVVNPLKWFAMRLRPGVKYEDINNRFNALADELRRPQLFYPYDEIAKKINKKIVIEKRPVISDIVFFRTKITDIYPMFCRIGDLAWCYTTTGHPGSAYAPIPQSNFDRFQEAIGHFTPDYQVAPMGSMTPLDGERIVVVGGLFGGQEIDINKVIEADTSNIYRICFDSKNGIDWKVGVDRRNIKKVK